MFKITEGKGFHITLSNGYTLSVQFGYGNYGDNYDQQREWLEERAKKDRFLKSTEAEIYCWHETNKTAPDDGFTFNDDGSRHQDVKGYVNADEVLRHLQLLAALPNPEASQ